jgi:hypothetical protein
VYLLTYIGIKKNRRDLILFKVNKQNELQSDLMKCETITVGLFDEIALVKDIQQLL